MHISTPDTTNYEKRSVARAGAAASHRTLRALAALVGDAHVPQPCGVELPAAEEVLGLGPEESSG